MGRLNITKLFALLLLVVVGTAVASQPSFTPRHLPLVIGTQVLLAPQQKDVSANTVNTTIDQLRDHLIITSDTTTFSQRVWYNEKYYTSGSGIHFLWVGGGQEADPTRIDDDTMPIVALAKGGWSEAVAAGTPLLRPEQALPEDVREELRLPEQRAGCGGHRLLHQHHQHRHRGLQPAVGGVRLGLRRGSGCVVPYQVSYSVCRCSGQLPSDVH